MQKIFNVIGFLSIVAVGLAAYLRYKGEIKTRDEYVSNQEFMQSQIDSVKASNDSLKISIVYYADSVDKSIEREQKQKQKSRRLLKNVKKLDDELSVTKQQLAKMDSADAYAHFVEYLYERTDLDTIVPK